MKMSDAGRKLRSGQMRTFHADPLYRQRYRQAVADGKLLERQAAHHLAKMGAIVIRSGWPDYIVDLDGYLFGLEIKRTRQHALKRQAASIEFLANHGIPTLVMTQKDFSHFGQRLQKWFEIVFRSRKRWINAPR